MSLDETMTGTNPLKVFGQWFAEAAAAGTSMPEAMTLATASADGSPSARVVLLKGFDESGFWFVSNYQSRKGRELEENPRAALVFWWVLTGHQVRIEGTVTRTTADESDAYFASRPRGSQIGAWASAQSSVIANREQLESEVSSIEARYQGIDVPRPEHWGGYRLYHETVELWQNQDNRLHDRVVYTREGSGWTTRRLAP